MKDVIYVGIICGLIWWHIVDRAKLLREISDMRIANMLMRRDRRGIDEY